MRAQWVEACEEAREMLAGKDGSDVCGRRRQGGAARNDPGDTKIKERGRNRRPPGRGLRAESDDEVDVGSAGVVEPAGAVGGERDAGGMDQDFGSSSVGAERRAGALDASGRLATQGRRRGGGKAGWEGMEGGQDLVGKRIEVWWDGEAEWFGGVIAKYSCKTKKHTVEYDDGEVIVEDLTKSNVRILEEPPATPADADSLALRGHHRAGRNTGYGSGARESKVGAAEADARVSCAGGDGAGQDADRLTPSPSLPSLFQEAGGGTTERECVAGWRDRNASGRYDRNGHHRLSPARGCVSQAQSLSRSPFLSSSFFLLLLSDPFSGSV